MSTCLFFLVSTFPLSSHSVWQDPNTRIVWYQDAFEFANETTFFNEPTELIAAGYKCNYGVLSSTISEVIRCYGAYSCSKASFLSALLLECAGDSSCVSTNIKMRYLNQSYINISDTQYSISLSAIGVNGLIYSTVSDAAQLPIFCRGEQSCAHSILSGFSSILGTGAYSLLNTSIDSINGTANVSIYFSGYYAGFGAIIACRTGQICIIECYSNGCTNIHLNCNDNCIVNGAINHVLSIQDVLLYDSFIISQQNDALCSAQVNEMNFDDVAERKDVADVLDNLYGGPICCRSLKSCRKNSIHYTSFVNASIICSGQYSCSTNSNIYNYGSLFCGARWSCANSHIITTGSTYCNGFNSCSLSFISKSSRIYCTAERACHWSTITSNGTDLSLYLSGHEAGLEANVTCSASDHCSIFCYGHFSCKLMILVCDGTCSIYCDFYSKCPKGWKPTTINPSQEPTVEPTVGPTKEATLKPSAIPSMSPSAPPTVLPTALPTAAPIVILHTTASLSGTNTTLWSISTTIKQLIAPLISTTSATMKETTSSQRATPNEPEHVASESTVDVLLIIIILSIIVCIVIVILFGVLIRQLNILKHAKEEDAAQTIDSDEKKQADAVFMQQTEMREIVQKNVNEKSTAMLNVVSRVVEISIESEDESTSTDTEGVHVTEEGVVEDDEEADNAVWRQATAGFIVDHEEKQLQCEYELQLQPNASVEHTAGKECIQCSDEDVNDKMDNFKRQNTRGEEANVANDEFVINEDTAGDFQ